MGYKDSAAPACRDCIVKRGAAVVNKKMAQRIVPVMNCGSLPAQQTLHGRKLILLPDAMRAESDALGVVLHKPCAGQWCHDHHQSKLGVPR